MSVAEKTAPVLAKGFTKFKARLSLVKPIELLFWGSLIVIVHNSYLISIRCEERCMMKRTNCHENVPQKKFIDIDATPTSDEETELIKGAGSTPLNNFLMQICGSAQNGIDQKDIEEDADPTNISPFKDPDFAAYGENYGEKILSSGDVASDPKAVLDSLFFISV